VPPVRKEARAYGRAAMDREPLLDQPDAP